MKNRVVTNGAAKPAVLTMDMPRKSSVFCYLLDLQVEANGACYVMVMRRQRLCHKLECASKADPVKLAG